MRGLIFILTTAFFYLGVMLPGWGYGTFKRGYVPQPTELTPLDYGGAGLLLVFVIGLIAVWAIRSTWPPKRKSPDPVGTKSPDRNRDFCSGKVSEPEAILQRSFRSLR